MNWDDAPGGPRVDGPDLRASDLLRLLPPEDLRRVAATASVASIARGATIHAFGGAGTVLFPLTAVFAVLMSEPRGGVIALASLGSEGANGLAAALGAPEPARDLLCVVGGEIARLPGAEVAGLVATSDAFRLYTARYLGARDVIVSQVAVCNRFHPLEARLARVLLTAHDRVGRVEVAVTQETIAMLLGASRPKLSSALDSLRRAGLVECRPGLLRIVDPTGLRDVACPCYATIAQALRSLREAAATTR